MNIKNINSEHEILKLATFAGEIVLTSGGEIYRVEDIIGKIGEYFNIKIDSFATLTCIFVSSTDAEGRVFSLVKRIKERSTNLDKVHKINGLIDSIDKYSFESLKEKLEKIDREKIYPFKINLLGSALGAGSFAICFKGGYMDFIAAFTAGILISCFSNFTSKLKLNSFFLNLFSGAICALVANIFFVLGALENPSISIISGLMLLAPGVAFINSIRDVIAGDLVAGVSRAMEVLMTGGAIAIGAGMILKLFLEFGGY